MGLKTSMRAALILPVGVLLWPFLLWPLSVHALEEFGVYEKWKKATMRSHRWRGDEDFGGQEVTRSVQAKTLLMRYRMEGFIVADPPSGSVGAFNRINFAVPTSITQIEAGFTLDSLTLSPCAANNDGAATRARPVQVLLRRFNDGREAEARPAIISVVSNCFETEVLRTPRASFRSSASSTGAQIPPALAVRASDRSPSER